ncbi:MAG: hypothetical protein JSS56_19560 [Proteobacteria bacterium]|nr:hypothetical protein [Pseudomonadota bacterium]
MATGTAAFARPAPGIAAARVSLTGRLFISVMLILIFEGAIRKWVSSASTLPLILLRDLLASYVVVRALTHGHFRHQRAVLQVMVPWSACVLGWGLLQLTLGESNFAVLLIGLRFWLLYIWFALAAAAGMNERDYIAAVRTLLYTLILMAPLGLLQRYSPPGAFINQTLDTDAEDLFTVVAGVVRTTGTFSFTSGFGTFINICTPFALGAFAARRHKTSHRIFALVVLGALIICTLVSGARSSFVYTGAMLGLYLLGNLAFAPLRRKGIVLFTGVVALVVVGGLAFVFQGTVDAIQERFQAASQNEDAVARVLAIFLGEPAALEKAGWLGVGIGLGSNLAQYVQTGGRAFVYAESEAGRTVIEGGVVGAMFLFMKLIFIIAGVAFALKRSMQTRAIFPLLVWFTVAVAFLSWPAIGQLTANGLLGVLLALGLLSLRYPQLRLFT